MTNNRVVLAYSGGLKSSVAIPWLAETYRSKVVAVTLDLGQGDDLADIRQRALAAGADRCHVVDATRFDGSTRPGKRTTSWILNEYDSRMNP